MFSEAESSANSLDYHRPANKILFGIILVITMIALPLLAPYSLLGTFPSVNDVPKPSSRSSFEAWELQNWWGVQMETPAELSPVVRGLFEREANERSGVVEWGWNYGYNKLTISWGDTSVLIIDPNEQFRDGWERISLLENVTNLVVMDGGELQIDERLWSFEEATLEINGVIIHGIIALAFYEEAAMAYSFTYFDTAQNVHQRMTEWSSTFRTKMS